jgi:hypothetical protein
MGNFGKKAFTPSMGGLKTAGVARWIVISTGLCVMRNRQPRPKGLNLTHNSKGDYLEEK